MTRTRLLALGIAAAGSVVAFSACAADSPTLVPLTAEAERGKSVSVATGCATCHGADGTGAAAPGYQGMWGTTITFEDDSTGVYDEAYVIEAIRDPAVRRRDGVSAVTMPAYDDAALSDEDLAAIVAFIREMGAVGR